MPRSNRADRATVSKSGRIVKSLSENISLSDYFVVGPRPGNLSGFGLRPLVPGGQCRRPHQSSYPICYFFGLFSQRAFKPRIRHGIPNDKAHSVYGCHGYCRKEIVSAFLIRPEAVTDGADSLDASIDIKEQSSLEGVRLRLRRCSRARILRVQEWQSSLCLQESPETASSKVRSGVVYVESPVHNYLQTALYHARGFRSSTTRHISARPKLGGPAQVRREFSLPVSAEEICHTYILLPLPPTLHIPYTIHIHTYIQHILVTRDRGPLE